MKIFLLIIALITLNCNIGKKQTDYDTKKILALNIGERLGSKHSQISGLDWHGDELILLPQFPADYGNRIFSIQKADIIRNIDGDDNRLKISEIIFNENGLRDKIPHPEYEAIAFNGDVVYLLTEKESPMESYIVRATLNADNVLTIESHKYQNIPIPFDLYEMGCESIVIIHDTLYVFYEANGANINPSPQVFLFDLDLNPLGTVPQSPIEFRVTDATRVDQNNSFWVINNFWEGEENKLKPAQDNFIPDIYDMHEKGVKRLLRLELVAGEIKIADLHTIMLEPGDWNWEGLVKLDDRGFLIINDEYSPQPEKTMLGFISITK